MAIIHRDDILDITNSLGQFIRTHEWLDTSGNTQTMSSKFSGLSVGIGWPRDFKKLVTPHIGVEHVTDAPRFSLTWEKNVKPYRYIFNGFAGVTNDTSGEASEKQRLQMLNDLMNIFDPKSTGVDYIDLFDYSTGTSENRTKLDTLQVGDVQGRTIRIGASDALMVSKYRFEVALTAVLFASQ